MRKIAHSYHSKPAVLSLFRLPYHLLNFVSVRRPPRPSIAKVGSQGGPLGRKIFNLVNYTQEIRFLVTEMKKCDKFQTFFCLFFLKIRYTLGLACGPPCRWLRTSGGPQNTG